MEKDKQLQRTIDQRDHYKLYYDYTYKWLDLMESGTGLLPFFAAHHCGRMAIYGFSGLGKMLKKELERTDKVKIAYFMDRNAINCRMIGDIPVLLPSELPDAPEVDMIVVTALTAFHTVNKMLLEIRPELPVVSLQKIIDVRLDEEWAKRLF